MANNDNSVVTIIECLVCKVKILNDSVVLFSYPLNSKGTKERLKARVCQYAKSKKCINNYEEIVESECY